jgi:subtilisin family serine protease
MHKLQENTYVASVHKSKVIEVSNDLFLDSRIVFAHPNFDIEIKTKSISENPLSQYAGFLRALQIEKLWKLAPKRGEGINVAVIDTEVDIAHIDLQTNLGEQYTPKRITKEDKHGTNCVGIISASDNNKGSIGIAPNTKFYPVTLSSKLSEVIKSINWLVDKNISVLNNSWGTVLYDALTDSLKNLAVKGRQGKGTIILFASGNSNKNYDYSNGVTDQSQLDFVLGVGATNELGEKADYSNYGKDIDIYAFGGGTLVGVLTTSPQNKYTASFGGTSAASPVVGGIIALMFSINPELSFEEVKSILQDTADITSTGLRAVNALSALSYVKDHLPETPFIDIEDINTSSDISETHIKENKKITKTSNVSNISTVISSIDNISIKQGWNMFGTSFDINTSILLDKYKGVFIFTQDKNLTKSISYITNPIHIKAGEGFFMYKH